jgi:hypothetical protein
MSTNHVQRHHKTPRAPAGAKESGSQPPSEMSDTRLLRFGIRARYMCSREGLETWEQRAFSLQLREARKEWKKRFPTLPLSTTFDEKHRWPRTKSLSVLVKTLTLEAPNGTGC